MIGLLGGTFDPIHYGHLRPAQEAMHALGLSELRLIPTHRPPHRPAPQATPEQRLQMVRLACGEFPGFIVDERELKRDRLSYTVETLDSLRADVGEQPLCWLMGMDAFRGFETWNEWERIPDLAHLVVLHRPGWDVNAAPLPEWARLRWTDSVADLARTPAGRLLFQPVTLQDISGTHLRAALARHEPVEALLPAPVLEYIRTYHIYMNADR